MSAFSFTKKNRIRKRHEFIKIYRTGSKRESQHFIISQTPNNLPWRRLGVTVSKRVGNAVQRNYVKRRLREFFRLHQHQLPSSYDFVITAKPGAAALLYKDICSEIALKLLPGMKGPDKDER
ncbi:ribonuclease P protein component [Thermodesulfobacteriota bacterium]